MKKFKGLFEDITLDKIGTVYNTDKSSKYHDFLRKYQFFLERWKEDRFKLLELGIFEGASLKTWRDYFINATIIGVDIQRPLEIDNCTCLQGDLSDIHFLASLQTIKPRIIIDDASHIWADQITAFFHLFPHLEPGGIYILEDISTSFELWSSESYKSHESVSPFHLMETLAECLTSQEKMYNGTSLSPLSPPSPYQSMIEAIAKKVDCVSFIKSSCVIVKKTHPSL